MPEASYFAPWMIWVVIAVVAGLLELLLPYFTFILVCLAALIAAAVSPWFGWTGQALVFVVSVLAFVSVLRPWLVKRVHVPHHIKSRSQRFHDTKGEVTEAIDPLKGFGRVMVGGEDWAARADHAIAVGQIIEVIGSDGIVLIVKEI